jgi:glucose/arabinose dehydrogenase
MKQLLAAILILMSGPACSSDSETGQGTSSSPAVVEKAFPGLTFEQPLEMKMPDDGTNRLFVVEQPGRIYVFPNDSTTAVKTLFLDITDRVNDAGYEEGLLGLAFHPDFATNGYFYVNYTAESPRRTVISRFSVDAANANAADPASEQIILTFGQPYSNHNGGCLQFGPDGYLYIAVGDGGSGGDPEENGQDRATLLGSILRIDIDTPGGGAMYGIPADNPFAGNSSGFAEEIYAYGLRNPWRFSFDPDTDRLWAGDVGQNQIEEVDIIVKGGNYGWNIMEGRQCYDAASCDTTGLILPVAQYTHTQGQSITGGSVYRGNRRPDLVGKYIYADFLSGRLWVLTYISPDNVVVEELADDVAAISSFAVDGDNELYLLSFDGSIYRFTVSSD